MDKPWAIVVQAVNGTHIVGRFTNQQDCADQLRFTRAIMPNLAFWVMYVYPGISPAVPKKEVESQ